MWDFLLHSKFEWHTGRDFPRKQVKTQMINSGHYFFCLHSEYVNKYEYIVLIWTDNAPWTDMNSIAIYAVILAAPPLPLACHPIGLFLYVRSLFLLVKQKSIVNTSTGTENMSLHLTLLSDQNCKRHVKNFCMTGNHLNDHIIIFWVIKHMN